jgi:hypothetical protein
MTLDLLIVVSGIVLSSTLVAILTALWPSPRRTHTLCLKARRDADCAATCIRACQLATPSKAS